MNSTHKKSKLSAWEILLLQEMLEKSVDTKHVHAKHLLLKLQHAKSITIEIPKEMED